MKHPPAIVRTAGQPLGTLLVAGLCLFACACRTSDRAVSKDGTTEKTRGLSAEKTPTAWQTRLGRIVLVNAPQDFVLIDAGTAPVPEPGTRLRAYSNGELSAELSVGAHQQRPFLIAEIISGLPRVSDMVVPFRSAPPDGRDQSAPQQSTARESNTTVSPAKHPSLNAADNEEIPQIERRPPPPAGSLLTPRRPMAGDSEAIIPGLPTPGKNLQR